MALAVIVITIIWISNRGSEYSKGSVPNQMPFELIMWEFWQTNFCLEKGPATSPTDTTSLLTIFIFNSHNNLNSHQKIERETSLGGRGTYACDTNRTRIEIEKN